MRIFVNRRDEMSGVDRLVRDNAYSHRMAIFHAIDGMGKTSLLTEIYDRFRPDTASALIDLGQKHEMRSLLDGIADQFADQGVAIPLYRERARKAVDVRLENVKARKSPINVTISERQLADGLLRDLLDDLEGPLARCAALSSSIDARWPKGHWKTG